MRLHRLLALVMLLAAGVQARATITLVSPPATGAQVLNPANQRYTPDPYNIDKVFYWTESTSYALTSNLVVSILPPATFPTDSTSQANHNALTIPTGTTVDSYMLNYDPQSGSIIATFSFDQPILGLITNSRDIAAASDHFVLSDYLINPLVPAGNIPTAHYDARGMEPIGDTTGDYIHWISPTSIEVHLNASSPGDQIRVITAPVPEPASLVMLACGAAGLLARRGVRGSGE